MNQEATSSTNQDSESPPPNSSGSSLPKSETESLQKSKSSCLTLPEFLHQESLSEFHDDLNPTTRTKSDLILPAIGLQRTPANTVTGTGIVPPQSQVESATVGIVTEKIDHPEEILDILKSVLVTSYITNESEGNLKLLIEQNIKYRKLIQEIRTQFQNEPTPLVKLQKFPQSHNLTCDLWVKCEFQNFSGSSKDRVALILLKELETNDKITSSGTIITHSSANFALALACANNKLQKNYKILAILPDRLSKTKRLILERIKVKIFRCPEESTDNIQANESPKKLAQLLNQRINDSVILDLFENPLSVLTHFLWTGPEILSQLESQKRFDMVVCGYETGGMISGLAPFFKSLNENCQIIGTDFSGHFHNLTSTGPETIFIEDYSTPLISKVLNSPAIDRWYKISPKEASHFARQLILTEGIPATATSGGVLAGCIKGAGDFKISRDMKILLILDNSPLLTDFDLYSNDWLLHRNYVTHSDLELTTWYHKMFCWRIPVKIPVTVFNDFNASAVYAMMKSDGTDRVVVQDSRTNVVLGIASIDSLKFKLTSGILTDQDLIGMGGSICTSFKLICINQNLSTLLELFKTHKYALLIQRQKFVSTTRGRMEQDWITGILSVDDVVRFISDIEVSHAKKFGMNLCGGFYRENSHKVSLPVPIPETVVMTMTLENCIPPTSLVEFIDPEREFSFETPPSAETSSVGPPGDPDDLNPNLTESFPFNPNVSTSSELSEETPSASPNFSEDNSNTLILNESAIELSESIMSAWYTTEGVAIAPSEPSSNILMTPESASLISSETSSRNLMGSTTTGAQMGFGMHKTDFFNGGEVNDGSKGQENKKGAGSVCNENGSARTDILTGPREGSSEGRQSETKKGTSLNKDEPLPP